MVFEPRLLSDEIMNWVMYTVDLPPMEELEIAAQKRDRAEEELRRCHREDAEDANIAESVRAFQIEQASRAEPFL